MHFFLSTEGPAGYSISHSIDSQCFVCRLFFCLGDSDSFAILYSKRPSIQCVHLRHETGSAWSVRRGRGFLFVWFIWLPLFCFGNSDCCRVFFKPYSPLPPDYASQKRLAQNNVTENVLTWSVVSIWNLVPIYGRMRRKFFPSWGFCVFFCLLDFSP